MKYSEEALKRLLGQVRHEGLARQTGSPSDEEIGTAQLAGLAAHHIPCLVHELREAEAHAAQLLRDNEALRQELAEGSDYCETLQLQLLRWSKQPAYAWQLAGERLPPCPRIHPQTGHLVSSLKLVAQNGVTLLEPHYLRGDDGAWFAQTGSFATHGITHWQDMPADPPAPPHEQPTPPQAPGERAGLGGSEEEGPPLAKQAREMAAAITYSGGRKRHV